MSNDVSFNKNLAEQLQTSGSGHDILRYVCLPDLLGKDALLILYIMGKNLARKMKPSEIEEIIECFRLFGWGELQLVKEKRREIILELTGTPVTQRFRTTEDIEYRLEAGFLAESLEQSREVACECSTELKPKKNSVQFNVIYTK